MVVKVTILYVVVNHILYIVMSHTYVKRKEIYIVSFIYFTKFTYRFFNSVSQRSLQISQVMWNDLQLSNWRWRNIVSTIFAVLTTIRDDTSDYIGNIPNFRRLTNYFGGWPSGEIWHGFTIMCADSSYDNKSILCLKS